MTTGSVGRVEHIEHATGAPVEGVAEPLGEGPTGDQVVDEALEVLDGIEDRPLKEHVRAFESIHGALQDRLAEGQR